MTKRILILQHVEPMWEEPMRQSKGIDPEDYLRRVIHFIRRYAKWYDKIIVTTLEYTRTYAELYDFPITVEEWSYAWEDTPEDSAEIYGLEVQDFISVSTPHQVAYLYDWLKEIASRGYSVTLGGAFEGECLTDIYETLLHLGVSTRLARSIIV